MELNDSVAHEDSQLGDEATEMPAERSLVDLRILIPESFRVGNSTYLDLQEQPITIAELQRAGLFLLTQLQEATAAHEKWTKLVEEYSKLVRSHEELSAALHGTEGAMQELLATNETLSESVRRLMQENSLLEKQLRNEQALRLLDQEMAALPKDQQ